MEQIHGSQMSEPERSRDFDAGSTPYRQALESVLRLHSLTDPERLLPQVPEAIAAAVGPCSGVIVFRRDGKETRHVFGPDGFDLARRAPFDAVIAKVVETSTPVVDGHGDGRCMAVPVGSGTRLLGAMFVPVAGMERRLGPTYVDVLTMLGRHVGVALDNAIHARDLSMVTGEEAIPAGLSLRDSKRLYERRLIRARLREAHGNIASAARSLDMDRGQLSRLLKKHGVDKSGFRSAGA